MRITALEIANFRGFQKRQRFDLDADAIVLLASNGQGKTSFLDAILWGLSGRVPRLGNDDFKLLSMYSDTGEMEVGITLRTESREELTLKRQSDGKAQSISLYRGGEELRGPIASNTFAELLWPSSLSADDTNANVADTLARSVYLQQDLLTDFIDAHSEQERFAAASDLLGAGKVNELQVKLDNARSAWSKATNLLTDDAAPLRDRVRTLEAQLLRLGPGESSNSLTNDRWDAWWSAVRILGVEGSATPEMRSANAASSIDGILREIQVIKNKNERKRLDIQTLLTEIERRSRDLPQESSTIVRGQLADAERSLAESRSALKNLQSRLEAERIRRIAEMSSLEEMRTLAQLALRHLEDRCPVCDQTFDRETTKKRLAEISQGPRLGTVDSPEEFQRITNEVNGQEALVVELRLRLRRAEQAEEERSLWANQLQVRLRDLGLESSEVNRENLQPLLKNLDDQASKAKALISEGEQNALLLARSTESTRRLEIENALKDAKQQLEVANRDINAREMTGQLATNIVEALREAATDVVNTELKRLQPILQRVYARIDPHPAFTKIGFQTRFEYRRGRLLFKIEDPVSRIYTEEPQYVLSSSQMNALAVSAFVALNLGMTDLPIKAAIFDDPLQSMDDINLLGVVDLLRRMKKQRQLVVTTHDERFANLLEQKLRPVSSDQRTIFVQFRSWTREGPVLANRDTIKDLQPLKFA